MVLRAILSGRRTASRDPRPVVGTGPGRSEGSPQPSPGERLCAAWQGEELLHENIVVRRPTGASFESGLSLFGSRRVRDRGFPVFSRQGTVSQRTTGAENVSGSIRGMIPRPSGAGPAVVRHISGGLSEGRLSAGGVGISGIRSAVPPRAAVRAAFAGDETGASPGGAVFGCARSGRAAVGVPQRRSFCDPPAEKVPKIGFLRFFCGSGLEFGKIRLPLHP